MKRTELKHWVNGIQKRGSDFYSFNTNIRNIGVMFCISLSLKYVSFNLFKLF